jgi:hypothetical protein
MDSKTLMIPNDVYQRVESVARRAGWDTADFIAKRLRDTFPPLQTELDTRPVSTLTDSEVIALALSKMPVTLNNRMSDLIADQKERTLDPFEVSELESLMDFYHAGQLRKAEAMVEAKARGLELPGLS